MATTPDDKASKQPSDTEAECEIIPEEIVAFLSLSMPETETEAEAEAETPTFPLEQPPPAYSPPITLVANESDDRSQVIPSKIKPTNFLLLANDRDSVYGEFIIDPSLCVPSSMLSPLDKGKTEADRKNLCLRARYGSVRAEIWLLAHRGADKHSRTSIALTSDHGYIYSHLHTVDATPFVLSATATHGSVTLGIPRGFTGLLLLSTKYGYVWLSEAIKAHMTQLNRLGDKQRYFVGDFGSFGDVWEGSQVEAEAVHGWVKVTYEDEGEGGKGLFNIKTGAVHKPAELRHGDNGDEGQDKKGVFSRLFRT